MTRSEETRDRALADGRAGYQQLEAQLLSTVLQWLQGLTAGPGPTRRPPTVKLLTFADVVKYFDEAHPGDPRIKAGALLRSFHPRGSMLFQVFLDSSDRICQDVTRKPYGRVMIAKELDDELDSKFAEFDLVIFR